MILLAPSRRLRWSAAAMALGALCVARVADAQTITPRFAWPAGATAAVTTSVRTNQTTTAGDLSRQDSIGLQTQATMKVEAHPEGLAITTSAVSAQGGMPGVTATDMAALTQLGGNFIVSKSGTFLRLTDVAALKQRMDSVLAPSLAQIRATAPAMASSMEKLSSPEFLTSSSEQSWLQMAGALIGRSWAPGDSTVGTVTIPMPLSATGTLSLPRTLRYDGVVACPDGRAGSCWQFTSRQVLSREALRAPMLDMLRQMGAPESMIDQIPIPESTTTSTLLYDSATLLPLRTTTAIVGGGTGPLAAMVQTGTTTVSYRWK